MRREGTTSKNSSPNSKAQAGGSKTASPRPKGLSRSPWDSDEPGIAGRFLRHLQSLDVMLLSVVVGMVLLGLLMVYSSSFIYAHERFGDGFWFIKKQIVFAFLGFGALYVGSLIPPRVLLKWSYPILLLSIALLVLVMLPGFGVKLGGAQRWIRVGFINFQPGELAKFAVILFVARQLYKKQDRLGSLGAGVLGNFLLPLPALLLLLKQPDFGTPVMITIVIFVLMFISGVRIRHIAFSLSLAVAAAGYLIYSSPYRAARFTTFLDPWQDPFGKGFQILQSLVGLHNGHVTGVGLGNGKEKLFFLPEAHSDFIFAVAGEELGFIGSAALALAFLFFVIRGLVIAKNAFLKQQDSFSCFLAAGITLILGLQGFINMGVVMGLLPTKGLALPFISYGGSALLVNLFAVGVLLGIARKPLPSRSDA